MSAGCDRVAVEPVPAPPTQEPPKVIAKEEPKELPGAQSARQEPAEKPVSEPKGARLRRELLDLYGGAEKVPSPIVGLLADSLDRQTVRDAGDWLVRLPGRGPRGYPWRVTAILAHAASVQRGTDVAAEIEKVFDRLYVEALATPKPHLRGAILWHSAVVAVLDHGTVELLTPGFWRGWEAGLTGKRVLVAVGNEDTLRKLREYDARDPQGRQTASLSFKQLKLTIRELSAKLPSTETLEQAIESALNLLVERDMAGFAARFMPPDKKDTALKGMTPAEFVRKNPVVEGRSA